MEYTYLGATGLKVSRLCLGTMNFGLNTDEKEAFRIMDAALDAGINFFDTANMYGSRGSVGRAGLTEEIIGRWFKQGGGRREKVVLATKVFADMHDENDGPNGGGGLSAYKIRRHLEASLKRLQTDHVEICYMHEFEPHAPWEELYGAFDVFKNAGKLDYIGCSNFAARQICYAHSYAQTTNRLGPVVSQHRYNLLSRLPEIELNPTCQELGLGVVIFSPLGMGKLSGSYRKTISENQRSHKFDGKLEPELLAKLQGFSEICDRLGESEAHVAVNWILSNPAVTSVIMGPRTVEQLDTIHALDFTIPEECMRELDAIFPGYDPAPGVYRR
ncbi:MAG: aldo/keto reductase [Clostridiales bacterium]|nr:aldo/keto reductase [Clostridiales bacterium]